MSGLVTAVGTATCALAVLLLAAAFVRGLARVFMRWCEDDYLPGAQPEAEVPTPGQKARSPFRPAAPTAGVRVRPPSRVKPCSCGGAARRARAR